MYEIRPETVKTFILDRNIKLPRFQRKQTWDEKKNFQLCISLFKEYPIRVSILSVDTDKDRTIRWLLDGRQRKNALSLIYEDPENIYNWGKKFIGFKNNDQPSILEEKFWEKIKEYIEDDPSEYDDGYDTNTNISEVESDSPDSTNGLVEYDESVDYSKTGLSLLVEIIKIIHNKSTKNSGFTKPFDLTKSVNRLPYIESQNGSVKLSSKRLKTFIDEYRRFCDDENHAFEKKESFYIFVNNRCDIKDKDKTNQYLNQNWSAMIERVLIIDKIDNLLGNSKIGMIEVKDLSPSDSQKIFNIINSEGEKLTAVEILSAKPNWNVKIQNPPQIMIDTVANLYKRIGTQNLDIVKWDLPATLIKRIGNNFILKEFVDTKSDFEKEITLGFKILSGIYIDGVKKEDVESLSKNPINWNTDIETIIYELQQLIKLIGSFDYFKYLKSWKISIMELTSDAIVLDFIILMYKDWARKGKPIGNDTKVKQLQKNGFILFDKLIFEYVNKQWRGSSDSKIANNIVNLSTELDKFTPIQKVKWETMLTEIYELNSIDGNEISLKLMKPILYHFYCLKNIQGPDSNYGIEVDHIIPQALFAESSIDKSDVLKDNILNLGLLPKDENISKGKKKLTGITHEWLKDQVEKYEFINKNEFVYYSDINNYKAIFKLREELFNIIFTTNRNAILIEG